MSLTRQLINAVKSVQESKTKPYDTKATVTRVEGDTVWVHFAGGVEETPVAKTIDAKEGDVVNVRVANGGAFLMGNGSAPPTDDTTARYARETASEAQAVAGQAQESADVAQTTADGAKVSADNAQLTAERVEESVDTVSQSVSELSDSTNGEFVTIQEAQDNLDSRVTALAESIGTLDGYIEINETAPYIKIASNNANYILISGDKVSMVADSQETAYMTSSRFYAPSAVVANLFMQIRDPSTGNRIGKLGTVMRSNGHYSLKRIF